MQNGEGKNDKLQKLLVQSIARQADGIVLALSRIASCRSQQTATIAEPLTMQGY
ncbi:hypothetical protein WAE56_17340 [Iodobacter sp. LRB]|uniref:hypothetical protein n=1 Tax=unclassified Iodobacter TaxID=235634 RepID=UPI0015D4AE59|nr:hypothetical protein [Iodobacter sp. BJB302]